MGSALIFSSGCWVMALAIAAAAMGAHVVESESSQRVWASANDMHLIHGLALIVIGLVPASGSRWQWFARWGVLSLIAAGLILFSFKLYCRALGVSIPLPDQWVPAGGSAFILAWMFMPFLAAGVDLNRGGAKVD